MTQRDFYARNMPSCSSCSLKCYSCPLTSANPLLLETLMHLVSRAKKYSLASICGVPPYTRHETYCHMDIFHTWHKIVDDSSFLGADKHLSLTILYIGVIGGTNHNNEVSRWLCGWALQWSESTIGLRMVVSETLRLFMFAQMLFIFPQLLFLFTFVCKSTSPRNIKASMVKGRPKIVEWRVVFELGCTYLISSSISIPDLITKSRWLRSSL